MSTPWQTTGEGGRRKQVKFRVDGDLLDAFDDWVDESNHSSRSDALRAGMRRLLGAVDETDAPRHPPIDEPERTAYLTLLSICNADGLVRHELAVTELSSKLCRTKPMAESQLTKLRRRGYLAARSNWQGTERAWKLRGYRTEGSQ